jgi:FkbM family methyltransferase
MKGFVLLSNYLKLIYKKIKALSYFPKSYSIKNILYKNFRPGTPFVFIQVGANDGISHDFLYEFVMQHESTGIVIEPLSDYFELLQENYAYTSSIYKVKKAVHSHLKKVPMYRVDPMRLNELPAWASGIGSLDPKHYKKSGLPEDYIIIEYVEADHLMNIIKTFAISMDIDLLQIDVEGYDFEVLKQVDFSNLKPKLIKLEYMNLSKEDLADAVKTLKANGYYCYYEDIDLVGVDLKLIKL